MTTAAKELRIALQKLQKPLQDLARIFRKKLADDEGTLATDTRTRLDSVASSLERRSVMTLQAWGEMLEDLTKERHPVGVPEGHLHERDPEKRSADSAAHIDSSALQNRGDDKSEQFVDWMGIERIDGRAIDVGLFRHWINPMKPMAASIRPHVHGLAVTSATLRDREDAEDSWNVARKRTGANELNPAAQCISIPSPFDYTEQTRVFVLNDVNRDDMGQVAGATKALFEASNGGALGLFTAIQRLRTVYEKISGALEEKEITLYAQHVDEIDPGTLVDMFRDDTHACLLGTDAVRDGVDVPGESLRLIAFDRVPWPRPTIIHKARREEFGGRDYDEMVTRLKLKQAFGRLIRRKTDKGVFVMLDSRLPSRLQNAFPTEVEIIKCGLAEAVEEIKAFLK